MACVLVVEDDPVIRAALIEVLTGHGYAVRTTHQGFEALREILRARPTSWCWTWDCPISTASTCCA